MSELALLNRCLLRRHFFRRTSVGLATAALASLREGERDLAARPVAHRSPPEAAAKRAIYLFMAGAPSQIDLWDYKPQLRKWYNKELPEKIRAGQRLTTMTSGQTRFPIVPSMFEFSQHGESGRWASQLIPAMAQKVDKISLVRSVWTEAINHDPAITYLCTGDQSPGKASLGAWISYGLGNLKENIPTFLVMTPTWTGRRQAQALYSRLWGSSFLPSRHQGIALRNLGDPILYLSDPAGISRRVRRRMLDGLDQLNREFHRSVGDPEILERIEQYESAFDMQKSIPGMCDLRDEPQHVLDLYGPEVTRPGTYAHCCILARRMAERGVRFTQIFHRGWDHHEQIMIDLPNQCRDTDQANAGLLADLEQRGMLEDTLVVWGGEFGRTVYSQGQLVRNSYGRDHHPKCFSMWAAGGGIRGGVAYGQTDEFSYNVATDPVHVRDIHATILHQLGIDHRHLTFSFQGLEQRLTGVEPARVVKEIIQ